MLLFHYENGFKEPINLLKHESESVTPLCKTRQWSLLNLDKQLKSSSWSLLLDLLLPISPP